MQWVVATAAFFASAVEFVEAFTIVLVVGVTVHWRSALLGALAAAATLALLVATLGVALVQWVPIDALRLVIGILLLLFGLKWLKNAILRYSGLKDCFRRPRRAPCRPPGHRGRCFLARATVKSARKHAQVHRRDHADDLWHLLDGRGI